MSEPAHAHLRVVDEAGEVHETCPGCIEKEGELTELTKKYRGALSQIGKLKMDSEADARSSKWWPVAVRLFQRWQEGTGHTQTEWSSERFWMIEKRLRDPSFGEAGCSRAIEGAIYDPFVSPKARKNGTHATFDGWDLIFDRSPDKTRDFIERAPLQGWEAIEVTLPLEERLPWHYLEGALGTNDREGSPATASAKP